MNRASQPAAPLSVSGLDFRALYEAEFAYVWRALKRLGVPERDVEDLCHDVFVAFYRGQEGYDQRRPIRPWLFGIAFRVASDYRRRAQNRLELPHDIDQLPERLASVAPNADEQVAAREARELVGAALAELELKRRAVFVLHDIDGYSMPEIANVLTAPLNTLYSRLRLARADFVAAVLRLKDTARTRAGREGGP